MICKWSILKCVQSWNHTQRIQDDAIHKWWITYNTVAVVKWQNSWKVQAQNKIYSVNLQWHCIIYSEAYSKIYSNTASSVQFVPC